MEDKSPPTVDIAGRAAFAVGIFCLGSGLSLLLDRIGAPEALTAALPSLLILVGLAIVGFLMRSMRISVFYAAGRAIPPPYAGMAMATLGLALSLPFLPPATGYSGGALAGLVLGYIFVALVSGPLLCGAGAFSLAPLLCARFPNRPLRLSVACVFAVSAGLTAFAGFEIAVDGLTRMTGFGRPVSAFLLASAVFLLTAPGGLAGIVWSSVVAGAMFVAVLGLPLALQLARGHGLVLPLWDDAQWARAIQQIGAWQGKVWQSQMTQIDGGGSTLFQGDVQTMGGVFTCLAAALATAVLAPLLAPPAIMRNQGMAARGGLGAVFWGGVMAALVAATLSASTLALQDTAIGRRADRLPDMLYAASAAHLLDICQSQIANPVSAAAAQSACQSKTGISGVITAQDLLPKSQFLLTGLSPLMRLGAASFGLVWAGVIALGLVLAASGFLALATALGNDVFYHLRDHAALTSRRLIVTRAILLTAISAVAILSAGSVNEPRLLIALALNFVATAIAPLCVLMFWPRALGLHAFVALLTGVGVAAFAVMTTDFLSLDAAIVSIIGFFTALAAGGAAAVIIPGATAQKTEATAFVAALRRGEQVIAPDKGA